MKKLKRIKFRCQDGFGDWFTPIKSFITHFFDKKKELKWHLYLIKFYEPWLNERLLEILNNQESIFDLEAIKKSKQFKRHLKRNNLIIK